MYDLVLTTAEDTNICAEQLPCLQQQGHVSTWM